PDPRPGFQPGDRRAHAEPQGEAEGGHPEVQGAARQHVRRGRRLGAALRLSGSRGGALAAALVLASGCAAPQRQAAPPGELDRFLGSSAAERIGTEGWIVVRELRRVVGGGAEEEAIVVEGQLEQGPDPERLRVSIWRPEREGWKRIGRTEPVAGDEVRLLELV